MSSDFSDCHKLIRFARKTLRIKIHKHASTEPLPQDAYRDDLWMAPDGFHVVMARLRAGRFAHELGHYCLLSPADRLRVGPGDLIDQGIDTLFEDFGAEAWGFAACFQLGISEDVYFESREDYETCASIQQELNPDKKTVNPKSGDFPLIMGLAYLQHKMLGVKLLQKYGFADSSYPRKMLCWIATQDAAEAWSKERQEILQRLR